MHLSKLIKRIPQRTVVLASISLVVTCIFSSDAVVRTITGTLAIVGIALLLIADHMRDKTETEELRDAKNALYSQVTAKFLPGIYWYSSRTSRDFVKIVMTHSRLFGSVCTIVIVGLDDEHRLLDEPDIATQTIYSVGRYGMVPKRTDAAVLDRDDDSPNANYFSDGYSFGEFFSTFRTDIQLLQADMGDLKMLQTLVADLGTAFDEVHPSDDDGDV